MRLFRRQREPELLDDRGRPITFVGGSVIASDLSESYARRNRIMSGVVIVIASMGMLYWAWSGSITKVSLGGLFALLVWAFFVDIGQYYWSRHTQRQTQSPVVSLVTAYRRCGACGYDLHPIAEDAEGFCTCPECGASWHRDRFIWADQNVERLSGMFGMGLSSRSNASDLFDDDRGVPMEHKWQWPPRWLGNGVPRPGVWYEMKAIAHKKRMSILRWAVPAVVVAWIVVSTLLIRRVDRPELFEYTAVLVVVGAIGIVVLHVVHRVGVHVALVRVPVDVLGLCNSCGMPLPEDATPQFDGCVVCTRCQRAWKRRGVEKPARLSP
ncbi:MAG: hypothetical protein IPK69_09160 [Phycisphaerales bacterium]|nr:MAG: hypothetical protein IPK69_09160 [Phycisphaerales bacterium]